MITEDLACAAIMRDNMRRAICLPRYTPSGWWECDVFELTKSGYFREYEVKLTLADFKADVKKSRDIRDTLRFVPHEDGRGGGRHVCDQELKHDLLAKGDPRGPSEFWYAAPKGLIAPELVPKYAGLIELCDAGEGRRPSHRYVFTVKVRAPKLHKIKADPKLRSDALGCCYWRFHDVANSLRNRTAQSTEWNDAPPPALDIDTP